MSRRRRNQQAEVSDEEEEQSHDEDHEGESSEEETPPILVPVQIQIAQSSPSQPKRKTTKSEASKNYNNVNASNIAVEQGGKPTRKGCGKKIKGKSLKIEKENTAASVSSINQGEEEKVQVNPALVPRKGQFFLHDDRGGGVGPNRRYPASFLLKCTA
jgi:hypothetical protein